MALTDEMKSQIAKDAGVGGDIFDKADARSASILAELLLLGVPGGAAIKAIRAGTKAARTLLQARRAAAPAKAAKVQKTLSAARTKASATRQRRTRVKLKREKDVAVSKQKPTARKEGGKDTTAAAPKQKAPDPIVEKKPPPRAPGLAKNRTRVDGKTPKKLTGGTKQLRERLLKEQARRQKG